MLAPTVSCPKCKGTGALELSEALRQTYALFGEGDEWTAEDCHRFLDSGVTAQHNRLKRLVELGFLQENRHGWKIRFRGV